MHSYYVFYRTLLPKDTIGMVCLQSLLTPGRALLLIAVPFTFVAAAVLSGFKQLISLEQAWRWCRLSSGFVILLATLSGLCLAFKPLLVSKGLSIPVLFGGRFASLSLHADAASSVILILVAFVGYVITSFSEQYLSGSKVQRHYLRFLMLTLACVCVIISTNNLAVLTASWIATSLSLHELLTLYSDRQPAIIAAHKKFLASRIGDLCMIVASVLIYRSCGTLQIDKVLDALHKQPSQGMRAAAICLVLAACVKCAQLPLHGWLIQVMEAPTPVSALLHAGIINLGGFLLIRFSPLVSGVPSAQWLLILVGTTTAAIASLVMMTRISVKVMLAWSTCAQMGFMLLECGLGVYELALLHLVAHSLYKAHAFLGSGSSVEEWIDRQRLPKASTPQPGQYFAALLFTIPVVVITFYLWSRHDASVGQLWIVGTILSLALTSLLIFHRPGATIPPTALLGFTVLTAIVYLGLHQLSRHLLSVASPKPSLPAIAFVTISFLAVFTLQAIVQSRPTGPIARRLYPTFYAGLFLDEIFTRMTFRIWPSRMPGKSGTVIQVRGLLKGGETR
jgi:NAD(P)H-quinone oxidoreductase subunit 5